MTPNIFHSFKFAWDGLRTVWREERNFRIEAIVAILVLCVAWYFQFSIFEWVACIIAAAMVLIAEIINTAVEDICNKIEPNQNPIIGKIKDLMGASVLVSVIGAVIIAVLVGYNHFVM